MKKRCPETTLDSVVMRPPVYRRRGKFFEGEPDPETFELHVVTKDERRFALSVSLGQRQARRLDGSNVIEVLVDTPAVMLHRMQAQGMVRGREDGNVVMIPWERVAYVYYREDER